MTLTLFCAFQPALIFRCTVPHYSLAHRRFSRSLFKAWKKKQILPVWQRLHHCLNHLKTLTKMLGLCVVFLGSTLEIHIFIFTETMWMLSVGLTTGVDSRAYALKVNCERLWQKTRKTVQQPLLRCSVAKILSSQGKPVNPGSGHRHQIRCLRVYIVWSCSCLRTCLLFLSCRMWNLSSV